MIRLGKFDKEGYKQNFSKGELARELVFMNKDYEALKKENKKYKEVINKAINKLGKYADEMANNANAYAICVDLLDILKEVEHGKHENNWFIN